MQGAVPFVVLCACVLLVIAVFSVRPAVILLRLDLIIYFTVDICFPSLLSCFWTIERRLVHPQVRRNCLEHSFPFLFLVHVFSLRAVLITRHTFFVYIFMLGVVFKNLTRVKGKRSLEER